MMTRLAKYKESNELKTTEQSKKDKNTTLPETGKIELKES